MGLGLLNGAAGYDEVGITPCLFLGLKLLFLLLVLVIVFRVLTTVLSLNAVPKFCWQLSTSVQFLRMLVVIEACIP